MRCLERSLKQLRSRGMICAKAEHWNAFAHIRQDLFGFIDIVALSMSIDGEEGQICAIQVVNTHLEDHITKIKANEAARAWVNCGGAITIHNWKQRSKNKRKRWELEEIEIWTGDSE